LTKVLGAHDGLERRRSYNKAEATIVSGGCFFRVEAPASKFEMIC
jgi:hypothetical protein